MTKLACGVESCTYNQDKCCRKDAIQVMGDSAHFASETCCGSFAQKGYGATNSTVCCAKAETEVKCEALKCHYNRDKVCSASHIGISGRHADSMKETECATFTC